MNEQYNAREVLIMVFCFLIVLGMGFMWGYEKGYESCMDDVGIKKLIEQSDID